MKGKKQQNKQRNKQIAIANKQLISSSKVNI